MKKFFVGTSLFFFIFFLGDLHSSEKRKHAITYSIDEWRRLGDNIITFCKAYYFSVLHNIPLLYNTFPYSNDFVLHTKFNKLSDEVKKFHKIINVDKPDDISNALASDEPILFQCHFLTETPLLYNYSRDNPQFETNLKKLIFPVARLPQLPHHDEVTTVALHVRKGGGFDLPLSSLQQYAKNEPIKGFFLKKRSIESSSIDIWPLKQIRYDNYNDEIKKFIYKKISFADYLWPIKFPPNQYYLDQLKTIASKFPYKKFLVHLFTDDPNPHLIIEEYEKALCDYSQITFSYRKTDNHHTKNVVEDLFLMTQCDFIISAHSSFAFAAHILGNHSLIIYPVHAITLPDRVIMHTVIILAVENAHMPEKRTLHYQEIKRKIL